MFREIERHDNIVYVQFGQASEREAAMARHPASRGLGNRAARAASLDERDTEQRAAEIKAAILDDDGDTPAEAFFGHPSGQDH